MRNAEAGETLDLGVIGSTRQGGASEEATSGR
jgi:hypothetical protein